MANKRKKRVSGLGLNISRFNIQKFTLRELKQARKQGFKRKRPKKPKAKSLQALQNYISNYNSWVSSIKQNAKTQKMVTKLSGLISRI